MGMAGGIFGPRFVAAGMRLELLSGKQRSLDIAQYRHAHTIELEQALGICFDHLIHGGDRVPPQAVEGSAREPFVQEEFSGNGIINL